MLDIEYKASNMGLNVIKAIELFFKRYKFAGLKVYDPYMNLLCDHQPKDKKNSIVLRLMVRGKHLYELNNNIDSLKGKESAQVDISDKPIIKVSDKYRIIENKKADELKEMFLHTYDKMISKIKKHSQNKTIKIIKIITSVHLENVLIDLMKCGYVPKVFFHNFLYKISFVLNSKEYGNKIVNIECQDRNPVYGQMLSFDNLKEYKAYTDVYNKTYELIIKKDMISDSNEEVRKIDDEYRINAVQGCFEEKKTYDNDKAKIVDENKAYTKKLMDIKQIPVFGYFDVYHKYDGHRIEDLTYYLIELTNENEALKCVFDNKINRVFGFVLKNLKGIKYNVLQYRKPYKIVDVDFKTPIDTLYQDENIDIEVKKNIVNKITGLMEQKYNKQHMTKIFEDYNEAKYYAIKYSDGEPTPIIKYTEDYEEKVSLNEYGNENVEFIKRGKDEKIYIVNVESKQRLSTGLSPVKDIIYLQQRLCMYNLYNKMKKKGFKIYGIKTDCLYYEGDDKELINLVPVNKEIGSYKLEIEKFIPDQYLELKNNKIIDIIDYDDVKLKTFKDEYKTKKINKYIKKSSKLMIEGLFPGVGKSTLAKNYDEESLFVCPYNKLCQVLKKDGFKSVTYSKIFGLFGSDTETSYMKKFDISKYKTIVFDEIYLYEPFRLKRIDELIKANPNVTFLATGDCDQRDPIGFNDSDYIKQCINIIFGSKIKLNVIKRLTDAKDKEKWINLKKDVFDTNLSIKEICNRNDLNTINMMNQVKTKTNVAYFQFRCSIVNEMVHSNILKYKNKFFVGLNVVCKKYSNRKGKTLNVNYTYKITKYDDKNVKILDELDNITYDISPCQLLNEFKLPYCSTCDSIQGLSFEKNEKITIFDANLPHTDRKYLWTAITRSRKLDDVTIYIHSDEDIKALTSSKLRLYFRTKVTGYKQQDAVVNRKYEDDDYINEDWIHSKVSECKMSCMFCKQRMMIDINENANINTNITVDRIDNSKAHIKSNCQICCSNCNSSKSNR
jgi:hypothetical protein